MKKALRANIVDEAAVDVVPYESVNAGIHPQRQPYSKPRQEETTNTELRYRSAPRDSIRFQCTAKYLHLREPC